MPDERETLPISKFKATCLAVLKRVKRTGRPVLITRFGEPIAEIVPPSPPRKSGDWLGCLRSRGRIAGDIVAPLADEEDWEVLLP